MEDAKLEKSSQDLSKSKQSTSVLTLRLNRDFRKFHATTESHLDWVNPNDPVIWASLRVDHPALLPKIEPQAVLGFLPRSGQVWFILWTDETKTHVEMLHYLGAKGVRFQATATYDKKNWRILVGATVVGKTNDSDIIDAIFKTYFREWYAHGHLHFIVTGPDVDFGEQELLEVPSSITQDLLRQVNCVLITYYDHGMDIVTSRLGVEDIRSIAAKVASDFNLSLTVIDPIKSGP